MDISQLISMWKLDNASGKHMLFIECPPLSHNANTLIFTYMGFALKVYQFFCLESEILSIKDKSRLADFDIILICVSGDIENTAASTIISKEFLDEFKKAVQAAEAEKLSTIPVVGMNTSLSGEKQMIQAKVFGGLFIGGDTTDEQMREMFRNLMTK